MDFDWTEDQLAFRRDLGAFLDEVLAEGWNRGPASIGTASRSTKTDEVNRALAERGWLTPHWPREHGGSGHTVWHQVIMAEESFGRGEVRGPQYMNVNWVGPSIMEFGTDAQQAKHLPPLARGEVHWCQGFSEPNAGSDLAALRTRAERDGDEYVINGSKIWTSYARYADYCFLLARTDPSAPPRRGISAFLVPMTAEGIEVQVIPGLVGDHSFHEVFFDDVRVSIDDRLGDENDGWRIIRQLLRYERVGIPRYERSARVLDEVAANGLASGLLDDPHVAELLAEARVRIEIAKVLTKVIASERAHGRPPSAHAYVARAAAVQCERAVTDALVEVLGADAVVEGGLVDGPFRNSLTAGVAAGAYETQLNMIATGVLELPRA